ncbi:YhgE/Pip domain-containing protein [Enterococcus timonensis]|uniref:YhgE/Pip domain-containing protein n=1 Tax=Enterococcus timonensis TaxID=1852364 RepID=UPI0008DAEE85|nr:YhgE/Pip domain-containing protein [Enterococcus timonensis]
MKHVKNIRKLFGLDWKRIGKHPVALLLVIALMILPSLYAWFNIKALWDPYENTSELPIAVYSADDGATFNDEEIQIGSEVIENLHDNDQLGWQFVDSKEDLTKGVQSGKYYAGIVLPENFSENLLSFTTGEIEKPQLEYYVNQKINAIAPKITDKGASSIQSTISSEFINTASSTLVKVFNEIGFELDSNLVSITKITSLIQDVNANHDEINGYVDQIISLNNRMPEFKEKLTLAQTFMDYLPQVDALTEKVVDLNEKFPEIKEQAGIILTLEEKIPEIEAAGTQLAQVDSDFSQIETTLNNGIEEAKTGLGVLQAVETSLPEIETLLDTSSEVVTFGSDALTQLQTNLPENLDQIIGATLQVLQGTSLNVAQISGNLSELATSENQAELSAGLEDLNGLVDTQKTTIANIEKMLAFLGTDNPQIVALTQVLQNAQSNLDVLQTRLTQIKTQVDNGDMEQAKADLQTLSTLAQTISDQLGAVDAKNLSAEIKTALEKSLTALDAANQLLTKAQALDLESFLTATETTVSDAITLLEKYQKELPEIKQEIHDANLLLNGHMTEITGAITTGADLYRDELPTLETKLDQAATFIENDWPKIEDDLTTTMTVVNEKFPEVENALAMAAELLENDWPTIEAGLAKAGDAIDMAEDNADLGEIISLLKLDATKEADFFTTPVELVDNPIYPVPNNGSASTPFYTALCLWVGALLLSSVASTDVYLKDDDKKKFSPREKFTARLLSFQVIGLAQGLIVSLGNLFLLHVYAVNPVWTVVWAELVALTFMTMVYVLAALFGNVGKGIAIIILVLSISGGGGNYPIQLSGKFFQMINPLLPFTHAVDLLREPVGGIYWPNATGNIWILFGLLVGFFVLGVILYPKVSKASKKLAEHSHRAHFFH